MVGGSLLEAWLSGVSQAPQVCCAQNGRNVGGWGIARLLCLLWNDGTKANLETMLLQPGTALHFQFLLIHPHGWESAH